MKKGISRKLAAFILSLAMILASCLPSLWAENAVFGANGTQNGNGLDLNTGLPANIPTEEKTVYVSILSDDANALGVQELNVGWFDLRPFITENPQNYTLNANILTGHALIEAAYYNLYGKDAEKNDLKLDYESSTAAAIRSEISLAVGDLGLSIKSIYDNKYLVMSAINNASCSDGIGTQAIDNGDRIDFYTWTKDYVYLELLNKSGYLSYGCPTVKADIRVMKAPFGMAPVPVEGAYVYLKPNNRNDNPNYSYGTTNKNGIAEIEFMRGGKTTEETLVAHIKNTGGNDTYLSTTYEVQQGAVSITKSSHKAKEDTSLKTLTLKAFGTAVDMKENAGNGIPFEISSAVNSVELAVEANSAAATVTLDGGSMTFTTGGSVSVNLDSSIKEINIRVTNNNDYRDYQLIITKIDRNIIDEINTVLNDISGSTYPDSAYDANFVMGKLGAGKNLTDSEKEKFLANVMNNAQNAAIGTKAKMAIALTALNIDARKVPVKNSTDIVNLVADVYNGGAIGYITNAPYMLMLMDLGVYEIPGDANWTREKLIEYICTNHVTNNYTGWSITKYPASGIDGSAMMVQALGPYYKSGVKNQGLNGISEASCAAIKTIVDTEIAEFKKAMQPNGAIDNSDTTANVIAALAACGIDSNTDDFRASGTNSTLAEAIFLYKTDDNKFGYTSKTYSQFSTIDCLQCLGSYKRYYNDGKKDGDGNVYMLAANKPIAIYTNWPQTDILTSIKISTQPSKTVYDYNATGSNTTVYTSGMVVTGIYNGDGINTKEIQSGYTVSTIDTSQAGTQTVTVSYQGLNATFTVTINNASGQTLPVQTVNISVRSSGKGTIASEQNIVIQENVTTVMDVLKQLLDLKNISYDMSGSNYISRIAGLGEFDEGPNSGWLYSVNGITPTSTAANQYVLSHGDVIQWYYTSDYTKEDSSAGFSAGGTELAGTEINGSAIGIEAVTDSAGKAEAKIDADTVDKLIEEMQNTELNSTIMEKQVTFVINADENAKIISTSLPKDVVKKLDNNIDTAVIETPICTIKFEGDTLKSLSKVDADINISLEKSDDIDGRPAFSLNITAGNKNVELDSKITVSFEYEKKTIETESKLVLCRIDENGNKVPIVKSKFEDGKISGITTGTGNFVLEYIDVSFDDTNNHWGQEDVEFLAARGVINGKSEKIYAPNEKIMRAEFVHLLYEMSGDDVEAGEYFYDISKDEWYAEAVSWAAEIGITSGTGNKNFSPNLMISRQDMSVMIKKYVELSEKETLQGRNEEISFKDSSEVAGYAKDAVTEMQKAGIINGIENDDGSYSFKPESDATRAEAATMLANYIKM